jgi:hypothetical protein
MDQPGRTVGRTPNGLLVRCVGTSAAVMLLIGVFFAWSGPLVSRAADSSTASDSSPAPVTHNILEPFDHDATSFPLRGAHRSVKCEQCHLGGQYKTLPTRCMECHNGQLVYGKPLNHLITAQDCLTCHNESAWSPVSYRHDLATSAGQCSTCHNGQTATGKPPGHVSTSSQCDVCHTTRNWSFTHSSALTAGQCDTCHNGQIAEGKPQGHVATSSQCDVCHTTSNWTFNHAPALTAGQCDTCHNGQIATGKPPGHVVTTGQCDLCHKSTTAWTFTHTLASTAGQCDTCHNGQIADGKPQGHFGTSLQCDTCHSITAWTPVNLSFHLPTKLIGAHNGLDCSSCHVISTGTVVYRDGTTYGSCANCHTRDYRVGGEGHRSIALDASCIDCHSYNAFNGN